MAIMIPQNYLTNHVLRIKNENFIFVIIYNKCNFSTINNI